MEIPHTITAPRRTLTSLILVLCFCASPTACIVDDRCAACKAVAERPRNHLDYRHRLDLKGQREGKVIDYRVSELRVVDLLDGLCAKMKPYVPNKAGGHEFWLKVEGGVPDSPEMAFNTVGMKDILMNIVRYCNWRSAGNRATLQSYCGVLRPWLKRGLQVPYDRIHGICLYDSLLETTEDELTEKIRVGEVATGDVERVLCQELSKHCKESSETAPRPNIRKMKKMTKLFQNVVEDPIRAESAKDVVVDAKDTFSMGSDGEL